MTQAYRPRRRCTPVVELPQVERPHRIVGPRGETRVLTVSGFYVSID